MPESKEIFMCVGEYMTDEELIAVRSGIEALGRILHCGDEKEICLPLMRTQRQISLRKNEPGKP